MKKKNKIISLTLILMIFIGYKSWGYYNGYKLKEDTILKNNIIKMVQNSEEIDFSKATNFNWDTLYVFTPYTDTKEVLMKDGVKYYSNKLNMAYKDISNIITFVDSKKIVKYAEINRSDFDFEPILSNKIDKNKAIFKVANEDDWWTLSLKK